MYIGFVTVLNPGSHLCCLDTLCIVSRYSTILMYMSQK